MTGASESAALTSMGSSQAVAQTNGRDFVPATGTAVLSGSVIAALDGQPLENARVVLSGGGLQRSLLTDESGRFQFGRLPAGLYTVHVTRAHFIAGAYGERSPGRPGTPIQLAEGAALGGLTVRLVRGAVITGTVTETARREAIIGASVRAMRVTWRWGFRELVPEANASSDDRGTYRVFDLPPGTYVVCATLNSGTDSVGGNPRDGARVYTGSCYPDVENVNDATLIRVSAGEEHAGIDLRMRRSVVTSISGVVTGGGPLPSFQLRLSAAKGQAVTVLPRAKVSQDGLFSFHGVPPGEYTISARVMPLEIPAPGMGQLPTQFWADARVSVQGTPASGIALSLQPGCSVSGKIRFEGVVGSTSSFARGTALTVALVPAEQPANEEHIVPSSGSVAEDLTFKIVNVVPGSYRLNVTNTDSWNVSSAVINGRDSLDFPVEITCQDETYNADVTLSTMTTSVQGTVRDSQGSSVSGLTVIAYPNDSRFWVPGARRIQARVSATDGRFSIRDLPPGDYYLDLISDIEPGGWFDPQFLKRLRPSTVRISLAAGDSKLQDLQLELDK
jgi:hypothetical protein